MGIALALVGAFMFWYEAFTMSDVGSGSGEGDLETNMMSFMGYLALLYIIGAGLSFVNSLCVLVQIPPLIIGLPVAWYLEYEPSMFMYYWVSLAGTSVITISMFIGYEVPDWETLIPPKSRLHVISISKRARVSKPFSRKASASIMAVAIASMAAIGSVAYYAWSEDVSKLRIEVRVSNFEGPVNFTIYLDGEPVHTGELIKYSENTFSRLVTLNITAGKHEVMLDAWNVYGQLVPGIPDYEQDVRTLPFTTDMMHMTVSGVSP